MARAAKLKVFRTPIGFHDAYVAAPSQKAALEAWGSDHNLFARGEAERVDDPALTAAPLAAPGTVIKRLRGNADEQFAALGPAPRKTKAKPGKQAEPSPPRRAPPRPDRAPLDRAEAALKQLEERQKDELRQLVEEERRIETKRRALERKQEAEIGRMERKIAELRDAYRRKLDAWRAGQ